jgi:hypothetical protein
VEAELGTEHPGFKKLLDAAREDMRRPWLSNGITTQVMNDAMRGEVPQAADQAMILAAQLTAMLAEGTKGNPRQIKRFLNSMLLRKEIGEARGFGDEISMKILAKLMLAERFKPDFFEELAREASGASNGRSPRLKLLEDFAKAPESPPQTKTAKPGTLSKSRPGEPSVPEGIADWTRIEWIRTWASLEPPLFDTDLRPYIFVTRDKRVLLGGSGTTSLLGQLLDDLMASPLKAKSAAQAAQGLTAPAAEELFDAVRLRILEEDAFSTQPPGVVGLIELVKMRRELERHLLDFAKELPVPKLGAWAPAALGNVFIDAGVLRDFQDVLDGWAEQTANNKLKVAAGLIGKVRGN